MAHFADLEQCTYFPGDTSKLIAVGWLEHGHAFETGAVDKELVAQLKLLLRNPWGVVHFMGPHFCDLCPLGASNRNGGTENLFVPGQECVFVCPELITHYIERHRYRPPDEFARAVMECPLMRSDAYLNAVERHYRWRS